MCDTLLGLHGFFVLAKRSTNSCNTWLQMAVPMAVLFSGPTKHRNRPSPWHWDLRALISMAPSMLDCMVGCCISSCAWAAPSCCGSSCGGCCWACINCCSLRTGSHRKDVWWTFPERIQWYTERKSESGQANQPQDGMNFRSRRDWTQTQDDIGTRTRSYKYPRP